jgi:hypothetical protein
MPKVALKRKNAPSSINDYILKSESYGMIIFECLQIKDTCSNEKKIWMTFFILMCISFFKISIPCEFFKINCHLLILNGHGPYVTLYAIKHA